MKYEREIIVGGVFLLFEVKNRSGPFYETFLHLPGVAIIVVEGFSLIYNLER